MEWLCFVHAHIRSVFNVVLHTDLTDGTLRIRQHMRKPRRVQLTVTCVQLFSPRRTANRYVRAFQLLEHVDGVQYSVKERSSGGEEARI